MEVVGVGAAALSTFYVLIWITEALNIVLSVSLLNHIVSILYERGLQAEPSIPSNSSIKWISCPTVQWSVSQCQAL